MARSRRRSSKPSPAPTQDVREIMRQELPAARAKALAIPGNNSATPVATPVSQTYLAQLNARNNLSYPMVPLARDPYDNAGFGPGDPLIPAPFDPALASGRPAPRRWEYPVSVNLDINDRLVPWAVLRDVADRVSIVRSCIDTCKAAITGLPWSFGIDSARARALAKRSNTSSHAVIADLQDKYSDDIDRLHQWWLKPDRINGWTFSEWLGALLEDQFVLDAVAVYPHLTMGGDLHSLELLDGSSIKPLQDHRGAVPQPPYAAYQQVMWGFPRGEWQASPQQDGVFDFVSAVYGRPQGPSAATDSLIYKVRNRRTRGLYGYSNVERALTDIDLWLKRWDWLSSEYTAGATPEMLVKVDAAMTPEQLRAYEAIFNDDLSGRTQERHRAKFLPDGFDPSYPQNMDAKFSSDLDLHLIRLICASFSVLPTSLGFTPTHNAMGSGGRGMQQGEQDAQLERGTKPTAQWITDLINELSISYLGMPPELSFKFEGLDDQDEQKSATLLTGYLDNGLMTLNEGRDQLNLPRYTSPKANEPFLSTPTGFAFLDADVEPVGMPGNLPSAPQNSGQPAPTPPAAEETDTPKAPRDEQVQEDVPGEKRAEQKAFFMFARNQHRRGGTWRDFAFKVYDPQVGEAANRLAAAGDIDAAKALFAYSDDAA